LDGRHRKVREVCGLPLIDVQERTSRPELIGGNHERRSPNLRLIYLHRMNSSFKHQFTSTIYQAYGRR
jgi:hypothetical protein